ncbi:MAG: oligosaccharide flippase family protein [Nanoarchaeota archaeon]
MGRDLRTIFWQTGISYLFTILGITVAPLLPFVLTRYLSVQEYGIYSLFQVTVQLGIVLLELALGQYIIAKLSALSGKERSKRFLSVLAANAGIIIILLLIASIRPIREGFLSLNKIQEHTLAYILVLVIIFVGVMVKLLQAYLISNKQITLNASLEFLKNNLHVIGIAATALILGWISLTGVFSIWLGGLTIVMLLAGIGYLRNHEPSAGAQRIIYARDALLFSAPLMIGIFGTWVISASDRYLINWYLNAEAVAYYSLPYSICGIILAIGSTVAHVLFPYVAQAKNDPNTQSYYLNAAMKYGAMLIVPASIGFVAMGTAIITLIASPRYLTSVNIIPVLATFPLLAFIAFIIYQNNIVDNRNKEIGIIYFLAAALNVGLNIALIPLIGVIGAAYSTVATYLFSILAVQIWCRKPLRVELGFVKPFNILFAGAIMGIVVYLLDPKVVLTKIATITAGGAIYISLLIVTKTFNKEEISLVRSVLRRITHR